MGNSLGRRVVMNDRDFGRSGGAALSQTKAQRGRWRGGGSSKTRSPGQPRQVFANFSVLRVVANVHYAQPGVHLTFVRTGVPLALSGCRPADEFDCGLR